ncbi:MAG: hypothetical protein GXO77_15560, partial [Calditrichaeota bacterium]|nr:hypothetical protein [Calditrichota bacterium]
MRNRKKLFRVFFLLLLSLVFISSSIAKNSEPKTIPVKDWLILGPIDLHLPAFHDVKNMNGQTFDLKNLLKFSFADIENWLPSENDRVQWDAQTSLKWVKYRSRGDSIDSIVLDYQKNARHPQMYYLASYIDANRFTPLKIEIKSSQLFRLFVDGKPILSQPTSAPQDSNGQPETIFRTSEEINPETGKHLLLIQTLNDPRKAFRWSVAARLKVPAQGKTNGPNISLSPKRFLNVNLMMDAPKPTSVSVSPDG